MVWNFLQIVQTMEHVYTLDDEAQQESKVEEETKRVCE